MPELADFEELWTSLSAALEPLDTLGQLRLAGEAISQIAHIFQERSHLTLSEIDSMMQDEGPVLPADFFERFVRQSMHVDFAQFVEPPAPLPRKPPCRQLREFPNDGRSVVGVVDKAALLDVLEQPPMLAEEGVTEALAVAHYENVSAWKEAICEYFAFKQMDVLPLSELVRGVMFPVNNHERGTSLVNIWLALLQGGYGLEQRGDFYEFESIYASSVDNLIRGTERATVC